MDTELIKKELGKKSLEYYKILCAKHNICNAPDLYIDFNLTGTVAGYAIYKNNCVQYNLFLAENNYDDFIKQVTGHEVAHLVNYLFCKQNKLMGYFKSHGDYWKMMMISINLNPDRCHNYEVKKAKIHNRNFIYKCSYCNKEYHVTKVIHNKINNGQKRRCNYCKSPVYFIKEEEINNALPEDADN
jgi:SprT protein